MMSRPKPKPKKKQVSPIVALLIIAVVLAVVGVLFWKGLQPPQFSEEDRKPPKAFLDMMAKSQGGKQGAIGSNMRSPGAQTSQPPPVSR